MKHFLFASILLFSCIASSSQSLDRMQWFNEPENWSVDNGVLTMDVTPQSDYWRISHYGFNFHFSNY